MSSLILGSMGIRKSGFLLCFAMFCYVLIAAVSAVFSMSVVAEVEEDHWGKPGPHSAPRG